MSETGGGTAEESRWWNMCVEARTHAEEGVDRVHPGRPRAAQKFLPSA